MPSRIKLSVLALALCLLTVQKAFAKNCDLDASGAAQPDAQDVTQLVNLILDGSGGGGCPNPTCDFNGDSTSPNVGDVAKLLSVQVSGSDPDSVCVQTAGANVTLSGTLSGVGRAASAVTNFKVVAVAPDNTKVETTPDGTGLFSLILTLNKRWTIRLIDLASPTVVAGTFRFPTANKTTSVLPLDFPVSGGLSTNHTFSFGTVALNGENLTPTNNPLSEVVGDNNGTPLNQVSDASVEKLLDDTEANLTSKTQLVLAGPPTGDAQTLLNEAKALVYRNNVTEAQVRLAQQKLDLALSLNANLAEAQLLRALSSLALSEDSLHETLNLTIIEPVLPRMAAATLPMDLLQPMFEAAFSNTINPIQLPPSGRAASQAPGQISGSLAQQQLEASLLPALTDAQKHLDKALALTATDANWSLTVPKNFDMPELGNYNVKRDEVLVLASTVKLVQALGLWSISWNLEAPNSQGLGDYIGDNPKTDTDGDGYLSPNEYLPANVLTLKTGKAANLTRAKELWVEGVTGLQTGIDSLYTRIQQGALFDHSLPTGSLAQTHPELSRRAFDFLMEALRGPVHFPALSQCFPTKPAPVLSGSASDRLVENATCVLDATPRPLAMDFSKFFEVQDFRQAMPYLWPGLHAIARNTDGSIKTDDSTLGGLFPDGLNPAWLEQTTKIQAGVLLLNPTQSFSQPSLVDAQGNAITLTAGQITGTTAQFNGTTLTFTQEGGGFFATYVSQPVSTSSLLQNTVTLNIPGYLPYSYQTDGSANAVSLPINAYPPPKIVLSACSGNGPDPIPSGGCGVLKAVRTIAPDLNPVQSSGYLTMSVQCDYDSDANGTADKLNEVCTPFATFFNPSNEYSYYTSNLLSLAGAGTLPIAARVVTSTRTVSSPTINVVIAARTLNSISLSSTVSSFDYGDSGLSPSTATVTPSCSYNQGTNYAYTQNFCNETFSRSATLGTISFNTYTPPAANPASVTDSVVTYSVGSLTASKSFTLNPMTGDCLGETDFCLDISDAAPAVSQGATVNVRGVNLPTNLRAATIKLTWANGATFQASGFSAGSGWSTLSSNLSSNGILTATLQRTSAIATTKFFSFTLTPLNTATSQNLTLTISPSGSGTTFADSNSNPLTPTTLYKTGTFTVP